MLTYIGIALILFGTAVLARHTLLLERKLKRERFENEDLRVLTAYLDVEAMHLHAKLHHLQGVLDARTMHDGWTIFEETQAALGRDYSELVRKAYSHDWHTPAGSCNTTEILGFEDAVVLIERKLGGTIIETIPSGNLFDDDCR